MWAEVAVHTLRRLMPLLLAEAVSDVVLFSSSLRSPMIISTIPTYHSAA